jgi:peptide/nickel transport system substrate-binding protein
MTRRPARRGWLRGATLALLAAIAAAAPASAETVHAIAMHGEPALPADFEHLPYVNPDAPKGGRLSYGWVGTFDSLNPFIVQGNAPRAIIDLQYGNNVFDTLMMRSADEPFTLYGLLAESVEIADDRSWIEFHINPAARFSDGEPVTADDVIFTANLLREKGRPNFRANFGAVVEMEKVGDNGVRFTFADGEDRELPLRIAIMPVLPEHATNAETFDRSTLTPMIGSGPYTIAEVNPGTSIVLRRNPDYWARDLPLKRGLDNFDEIRLEYFRDSNAYFEAFKAGAFDVNFELDPARWSTGYDFPALASGDVVLESVRAQVPRGMLGFVFNTRRPLFQDPEVRGALARLFDFEWINRNLYYGLYERTGSYFQGSSLSALGTPMDAVETALLEPYSDMLLPEVADGSYLPPSSDGTGRDRENARAALTMLGEAGWRLDGGVLRNAGGQAFAFEFMAMTREQERLALTYQQSLAMIGIQMSIRSVDATQFWDRQKSFDFDMMQMLWVGSLSPGREQRNRWSSDAAGAEGSFNMAGVREPGVDAMIDAMLAATDRPAFEAATRALDRLLISGRYVVPLFNPPEDWLARRVRIERPETTPLYGFQPTSWWSRPQ